MCSCGAPGIRDGPAKSNNSAQLAHSEKWR
jgi:hypothetical protein